jgi:hypothetical protein
MAHPSLDLMIEIRLGQFPHGSPSERNART